MSGKVIDYNRSSTYHDAIWQFDHYLDAKLKADECYRCEWDRIDSAPGVIIVRQRMYENGMYGSARCNVHYPLYIQAMRHFLLKESGTPQLSVLQFPIEPTVME